MMFEYPNHPVMYHLKPHSMTGCENLTARLSLKIPDGHFKNIAPWDSKLNPIHNHSYIWVNYNNSQT